MKGDLASVEPALDSKSTREMALKTGKSYFVISEWKGVADLSKKVPQIRKESVTNKKATPL